MDAKTILLIVLSIIAGFFFISLGIYFRSYKFFSKLKESCGNLSDKNLKNCIIRTKITSSVAIGLGGLTLAWSYLTFMYPGLVFILALVYMIFVTIAFLVLLFLYR